MKKYDVIIVGAGISGLSLAHYCTKHGLNTLVIEKSARVGGTFYTHKFSGGASDFWLELGAHTCYNSYGNLLALMEESGILDQAIKKEIVGYKMLVGGELKSIPSQINFFELLLSAPRLFTAKKEGMTIESYYSKIVGTGNFRKVFGPLFDAVICQKANSFPADMLFRKRPRRKDVLKSFTLSKGLQYIAEAIASRPGIQLASGKAVEAISFSGDTFSIAVADGSAYESSALALATPAMTAAQLLQSASPDLSALLSRIKVEAVETVGVALRKDSLSLPTLAGIIAVDDHFYSAVSRDTVGHEKYRGFAFHFKSGALDDDSKLGRIADVLKVKRGMLEHVAKADNFVPSLSVGHDSLVREIDRLISGRRLFLTGNYFSGVAIEDCVSRSLSEFERLKDSLNR
jgi:oxygen-dependent protoporphyrinogen oxidase